MQPYEWPFLSAQSITGFDPSQLVIDASGFPNPDNGSFTLISDGQNIALLYLPVPEPASLGIYAIGILLLLDRRRC